VGPIDRLEVLSWPCEGAVTVAGERQASYFEMSGRGPQPGKSTPLVWLAPVHTSQAGSMNGRAVDQTAVIEDRAQ
jgi:hypothetical protein